MDKQKTARAIIEIALPIIPFEGWTTATLDHAAMQAGLQPGEISRVFPHGVIDALNFWSEEADRILREKAEMLPLQSLKIRERIATLIRLRLEYYTPHKEALRRALCLTMQPWNAGHSLRNLHRTVDTIWRLAGDSSHDFNWYTKRLLLAGVYSSTLLYWLDDTSEGHARTWEFLNRRIQNVMQLGAWLPFGKKHR